MTQNTMKNWLPLSLVLIVLSLGARQLRAERVGVMVHRPSNSLAWNHLDRDAAFMLGCDRVLADFVRRAPEIDRVGAYRINGIVQGMNNGLYFPSGETIYDRWRPFLEADVYVECNLSRRRLQWRAGNQAGEVFESEVVRLPYQHPMACAAALVRIVFEAGGTELPAEWEAELHRDEPSPPELFFEWAQWIGYRPHWLHHAPWEGPQRSAKRILKEDPTFYRGAAWALPMLMRVPKGAKKSPASLFYVPQALRLLDSPHHGAAFRFLRGQLKDSDTLRQTIGLFGLEELELSAGLELDAEDEPPAVAPGPKGADIGKLEGVLTGPRFRRNLVRAIGPLAGEAVREALIQILAHEESPDVRAAAAGVLAEHHKETAEVLQEAFATDEAPEVRRAALAGLVKIGELTEEGIDAAAADSAPEVRARLVEVLPECGIDPAQRQRIWLRLLEDESPDVRAACIRQLHRRTELAPTHADVRAALERALKDGTEPEQRSALAWIEGETTTAFADPVRPLLEADTAGIRAAAATALAAIDPDRVPEITRALQEDPSPAVQKSLARILGNAGTEFARGAIFRLLKRSRPSAREAVCSAAYRLLGSDRTALARAMRFDPAMMVNLASLRLTLRLGDSMLTGEVLPWCVRSHPNEYIRARALQVMDEQDLPSARELSLEALQSPFWVLRLEAADVLSRRAGSEDAELIRAVRQQTDDRWLDMALEDALCRAEERAMPERVRLGLGETQHTPGGDEPWGFQTWLGRMPKDREKARRMVSEGYRFGVKTYPANMPAGMVLNAYNRGSGARNTYLLDSILGPLVKWKNKLPYLYYIALFDEPCSLGTGMHPERVRAMLLEAGRADLLPKIEGLRGDRLVEALPDELRRAWEWYNAKFGGVASNWVVHMFRLTAQRKYPDLRIFPQSLSYMRKHTRDAFNMINADGDYSWIYHNGNYYRDPSIGAVNRVINPGKPLCMVTWMGWHSPVIFKPRPLTITSNWKLKPWRLRGYFGTRSGLALWASGTEAGFFPHIGFAKESKKDEKGYHGMSTLAFKLKPWSKQAREAVEYMLEDEEYWEVVEGRLGIEKMKEKQEEGAMGDMMLGEEEETDIPALDEGPTPMEEKLQEKREKLYEKLMKGVSYMNIFNLDNTRALSNLPKPDTSQRDTLLIVGRDTNWWADGQFFKMPAEAIVRGWDLVPNYDCIGDADLMHYDTILLRSSNDGVTSKLVERINRWLREKENGLLIVWGDCTSDDVLFPSLTLDAIEEPFLWEEDVRFAVQKRVKETYRDRRGRERTRMNWPKVETFRNAAEETVEDPVSRLHNTVSGDVEPLITTSGGKAILARWKAPTEVKSVVLFDGAYPAGPAYTGALEEVVLAIDGERGSDVQRNRWWGHTIYENDRFVVDVATSQLHRFHEERPRRHRGVDIITGAINPVVKHRESALILKDYVGPYAGGRGDWAVMAREALKEMTVESENRLRVSAEGVTRISHIGPESIGLEEPAGFEEVENQVTVWKKMHENQPAYSANEVDGGRELHVWSPDPFTVVTGKEDEEGAEDEQDMPALPLP